MKLYALLKLKGITTGEEFEALNKHLFLGDLHFVMPDSNDGITLSFAHSDGYFVDELGYYCVCFKDLDKTWIEENHSKGYAELSYELLQTGYVDHYTLSFDDFTDVEIVELYTCDEETWEVMGFNIETAKNFA